MSDAFSLVEVAPGVHAALARAGGLGFCNAGIVDLGEATLVFDSTMTPQTGEAVRRAAERVTGHRVGFQVNSHWHPDHVQGNAAFADVQIISTRTTRDLISRRSIELFVESRSGAATELAKARAAEPPLPADELEFTEEWLAAFLACPPDMPIPPPTVTFDRDLVLSGPARSARVLTLGGGHSPSDVLVYLPESRTLFGGDLVMVGVHPSTSDARLSDWRRILGELGGMNVEQVVPGHGPVGSSRDLGRMGDYFRELEQLADDAVRHRVAEAEIARTPPPPEFASWKWPLFFRESLTLAVARRQTSVPS